jgi:hypothetical protein
VERAQFFGDRADVVDEARARERFLRDRYDKLVVDAAAALPEGYSPALDGRWVSAPESGNRAPKVQLAYKHVALPALANHYDASPVDIYQIAPGLEGLPLIGPGLGSSVAIELDIRGDQSPIASSYAIN